MPLLLKPKNPLTTNSGLSVAAVYAIINNFSYDRLRRRVDFQFGYYVNENSSLPDSNVSQLDVKLPTDFSFQMEPIDAAEASNPQVIMEQYASANLIIVLGEGSTIENVD